MKITVTVEYEDGLKLDVTVPNGDGPSDVRAAADALAQELEQSQ